MELIYDKIGGTWIVEKCENCFILKHLNQRKNPKGKFRTHVQGKTFPSMKSIQNYIKKHERKLLKKAS